MAPPEWVIVFGFDEKSQIQALDVATGEVIQECLPRHRHQESPHFLRKVEKQTDPDLELHFILDNYATHNHAKVKAVFERHPRVHFHFVPTSSFWLNLTERLFSELEQRQLKRLAFNSMTELEAAIHGYLEDRNQNPRPFVWTASAEAIIEKVQRGNETLGTLH